MITSNKQEGAETTQKSSMNLMSTVTGLNRFFHIDRVKKGFLKFFKLSASQSEANMSKELLLIS